MTKLLRVVKSNKKGKKFMAVFKMENGKEKTTHFGAEGMRDFTLISNPTSKFYIKEKDKREQVRDNYQRRHRKDLTTENNKKGIGAGALSFYLLWTTPKMNVSAYKRRFNL
tara:strand:- start:243 stop:575 length:333 start_codon:yes stop_codon:yes gene_type:complete